MSQQTRFENLERRLAFYTVAASAGMLAGAASAEPTDANINITVTAGPGSSDFEEFDVDGDSELDFELEVDYGGSGFYGGYCGEVLLFSSENPDAGWTAYAQPIAPGTQIDETFEFATFDWLYEGCPDDPPGVFGLDERGFIGFRLPADDARGTPTSWQYGYMDVEITGDLTAIIHEVIFETTPDTPITVAGTAPPEARPVPVGGAVPLGLLVLAAGAAALRRRNRAET